ncbi:hypothetical protein P9847_04160 [Paenibacillus chibensis]|uniref:Uncharacterized protein n=1 Tax=Paenibacillus chibensis TaxID=59846 RepID=A0ABU6PNP7_9BACL|nr:hypothetical protein [Paenibacillus chibensis]
MSRKMFAAAGIVSLAAILEYYFIHHKRQSGIKMIHKTPSEISGH